MFRYMVPGKLSGHIVYLAHDTAREPLIGLLLSKILIDSHAWEKAGAGLCGADATIKGKFHPCFGTWCLANFPDISCTLHMTQHANHWSDCCYQKFSLIPMHERRREPVYVG